MPWRIRMVNQRSVKGIHKMSAEYLPPFLWFCRCCGEPVTFCEEPDESDYDDWWAHMTDMTPMCEPG